MWISKKDYDAHIFKSWNEGYQTRHSEELSKDRLAIRESESLVREISKHYEKEVVTSLEKYVNELVDFKLNQKEVGGLNMKNVRYRGYSEESSKFIYGVPLVSGEDVFIVTVNNRSCDMDSRVIKSTVGQFIGMKDVNGVDIYEGDILKEGDFTGVVEYDGYKYDLKDYYDPSADYPTLAFEEGVFEVVGNAYENN